ncbi:helix-turn-helix domain-containing protein [Acetanaerobacterium elongatum]|uniref:Helix-turn-helix n=1 Tax=Acetanaerobacterium elongatum TaxID=258515 RepID=A0A1G9UT62_9FIRM|nr:helix-turn-helix transcriptional regulator [Acetanaerobacterium elongatum]SDM63098.1 Helix-turn-helix [Acetanaerobacterium elongatum]
MDSFAAYLKELIEKSGISIQKLSSLCGIERTYLHKMLSGERLCPDTEAVKRIAKVLMLDLQQTKKLEEKYLIAKMGEEVYARHRLVKSLIESFDNPVVPRSPWSISSDTAILDFNGDVKPLQGMEEVSRFVKAVVEQESAKENGVIRILAQPEYTFLTELLAHIGQTKQEVSIIHLMCLQRNISEQSDNRYNLQLLSHLVPLITSVCNYQPYYYYDDVYAHINIASVLPYLIITETYAMSISADASSALVCRSQELQGFYLGQFERILAQAQRMINRLDSPMALFSEYGQPDSVDNMPGYSLFVEPCFGHFLTADIVLKYMSPSLKADESIVQWMTAQSIEKDIVRKAECYRISFFLTEGLDSFIQSGRVRELPPEFYTPLDKLCRYKLLRSLYEQSSLGKYLPVIVNPQTFRLPRNLIIGSFHQDSITFTYISPAQGMLIFSFHERSVVHAILSFLLYLKESEYALPHEETMAIIREKVVALEEELNLPPEQRIQ